MASQGKQLYITYKDMFTKTKKKNPDPYSIALNNLIKQESNSSKAW